MEGPTGEPRTLRFGLFEADLTEETLYKSGHLVHLEKQPFRVLRMLLKRSGEVVLREQLQEALWPADTFVAFGEGINTAIKKLRYALGDSADSPRFIETVPRRGYRFIAPVMIKSAKTETEKNNPVSQPRLSETATQSKAPSFPLAVSQPLRQIQQLILGTQQSSMWFRPGLVLGCLLLLASLVWIGYVRANILEPQFQRLTFGRGWVHSARFGPDGETVIYSAGWEGKPLQLFWTRMGSAESRPLGAEGEILAISRSGEVAVLLKPRFGVITTTGSLALMPFAGSAPREVLDNVQDADWTPDGTKLVVTHYSGDHCTLEFPIGNVLLKVAGGAWLSHPRISPRGDRIAFIEHPLAEDDAGHVVIINLGGGKKLLSQEFDELWGLSWDREGDDLWVTAHESGSRGRRALFRLTSSGRLQLVRRESSDLTVHDISRDGRLLVTRETWRGEVFGRIHPETTERQLGWFDNSFATDLSPDGGTILLAVQGEATARGYEVYLRSTNGSAATRLGEALPSAISPDGKSVLALYPWGLRPSVAPQLMLLSIGPGQPTVLTRDSNFHHWATWLPGGNAILHESNEARRERRTWVQDIAGGAPRPITPEGTRGRWPSPDGKLLVAFDSAGKYWLYPMDGEPPRALFGMDPGEEPIRWSGDGRYLFVLNGSVPAEIHRLNVSTGQRKLLYRLVPPDAAGVSSISSVLMTPDGRSYVYSYPRVLSDLYIVSKLN